MLPPIEQCYRAALAKDARFDGWIYCGVTSTGIYCRPSCPARTPKARNIRFYPSAAAAQSAGFRACKRCRPDAVPGSPQWDLRSDAVGRAMRLIADGVVDREGVTGLAARLGYTERHVHRQMVAVAGAGPLAIARANRAHTARLLIETTVMTMSEVAAAAGFSSVRQFNATIREIFANSPGELRRAARPRAADRRNGSARRLPAGDDASDETPPAITLRLPFREPLHAGGLVDFLALRGVNGVEQVDEQGVYRRSLRLPYGQGVAELSTANGQLHARFRLDDMRDLGAAIERVRRLFDLDSDPTAADAVLSADKLLRPLIRRAPGRRVPGAVDGAELAMRTVLGQQVSVAGARTVATRLTVALGDPLVRPSGAVTHLFPSADAVAAADPAGLPIPRARARALLAIATEIASGELPLDGGADRGEVRRRLVRLPGIGPWTASAIAMRALRDPDAFLPTDLGVRNALIALGADGSPAAAERSAERWRPYRSYAVQHLWGSIAKPAPPKSPQKENR